jgi:hypothetical protein
MFPAIASSQVETLERPSNFADGQENLIHNLFRNRIVVGEAQCIPIDPGLVSIEQHLHSLSVALRDKQQERGVWLSFGQIP